MAQAMSKSSGRVTLPIAIAKIDSPILLPTYFFCRTELTRQTGGRDGWYEKHITGIKLDLESKRIDLDGKLDELVDLFDEFGKHRYAMV